MPSSPSSCGSWVIDTLLRSAMLESALLSVSSETWMPTR